MKKIIITIVFGLLAFSGFAQTGVPIGNDTDTAFTYNSFASLSKTKLFANPTGQAGKFFKVNAAGNGFEFGDATVLGSGASLRGTYWSSANTISSNANYLVDPVGRTFQFGNASQSTQFDILSTQSRIRFSNFGAMTFYNYASATNWAAINSESGPYGLLRLFGPAVSNQVRLGGSTGVNFTVNDWGVGTTTPERRLHALRQDPNNGALTYVARHTHLTNGTAAIGVGVGVEYELEDASGSSDISATFEVIATDATNGSEDADIIWKNIVAGTLAERMRLRGSRLGLGTTPAASAALDVSSTTAGFLAPRMTTTQRDAISTPANGLSLFNTSTNFPNFYDGTAWRQVASQNYVQSNFFQQGGNSFGSAATLGTNDAFGLNFETNGITYATLASGGGLSLNNSRFSIFGSGALNAAGASQLTMTNTSALQSMQWHLDNDGHLNLYDASTRRLVIPNNGILERAATKSLYVDNQDSLVYVNSSGTWTPTLTLTGTDTVVVNHGGTWSRSGNTVTYSLSFAVGLPSTAQSNLHGVQFTLPVSSTLTTHQIKGTTSMIETGDGSNIAFTAGDDLTFQAVVAAVSNDGYLSYSVTRPTGNFNAGNNRFWITITGNYTVN